MTNKKSIMEISIVENGDIKIARFKGNLDTNTASDVETCINDYLESGSKNYY